MSAAEWLEYPQGADERLADAVNGLARALRMVGEADPGRRQMRAIVPAPAGLWLVHSQKVSHLWRRTPVLAYALVDDDGRAVEALIAGDGGFLVPAWMEIGDSSSHLATTAQLGRCHCGRAADLDLDDPNWCTTCPGVIGDNDD